MMNSQTLQEFQNEKKKELIVSFEESWDVTDISQMQNHAAIAGRLAFLGEMQYLHSMESLLQNVELLARFEAHLSDLFKDLWMGWAEFEGETLGEKILLVQDLQGIMTCSDIQFSSDLRLQFEQLVDSIGTPILDTETKIVLDEFNLFYPMPKEKLLPVLQEPVSWAMYKIDQLFNPDSDKVWEPSWNEEEQCWEIQAETRPLGELISYKSEEEIRKVHSEIREKLLSLRPVQEEPPVFRVLDSRNEPVDFITTMRIGTHPVTQDEDAPELWRAESRWLSVTPEMIKKNGLSMRFADGSRANFPIGEHLAGTVTPVKLSYEEFLRSHHYAMAADAGECAIWTFLWKSPDADLEIRAIYDDGDVRFAEFQNQTGKTFTKIRISGHELTASEEGFWTVSREEFLNWTSEVQALEAIAEDGTVVPLSLVQINNLNI